MQTDDLTRLRSFAEQTNDFYELGRIQNELADKVGVYASRESVDLSYMIRRKRGEHEPAAILSENAFNHFGDTKYAIQAALKSIDSGNLSRTKTMIESIVRHPIERLDDDLLRNLCRASSACGQHELALTSFKTLQARKTPWTTKALKTRLIRAQKNLQYASQVRVISLGENCLPWLHLNRWGLRYEPWTATQYSPFNLAQTRTESVTKIIYDPESLTSNLVVKIMSGIPMPRNVDPTFVFNHECGPYWYNENFNRLRELYAARLDNMATFWSGGPRLFVHFHDRGDDIAALSKALEITNVDENYHLLGSGLID